MSTSTSPSGEAVASRLAGFPTPVLADALVRLGLPVRTAPVGISGPPAAVLAGRVVPVRHAGSVDVFLEVLDEVSDGDVLVVDNGGRRDEACIGDLVVAEAAAAGVAGFVVWGLHRDAVEVARLGVPVWSYGTLPAGPTELRADAGARPTVVRFGAVEVGRADLVVADANGALFLPTSEVDPVVDVASSIHAEEARQLELLRRGTSLREQFAFDVYLRDRAADPGRTFRQHLRELGRAVEE